MTRKYKIIGQAELVDFPEIGAAAIPARVDTGAKTSAITVLSARIVDNELHVDFFQSEDTQRTVIFKEFKRSRVASSNGHIERRFKVRMQVRVGGKKIRAWFTLTDRSTRIFPVLIGRNVLVGKFLVNVKRGYRINAHGKNYRSVLQSYLESAGELS